MSFWSGEKLLEVGERERIVEPFNPQKIDCSAYTLTLGPEAFVTPDFSVALRDSHKLQLSKSRTKKVGGRKTRSAGGEIVIPAGQFALLLTDEFVKIPRSAMGFISLRFSIKGTGLINVSGFHVDPGYEGRLIFSVYNAGPTAITMTRGQDLFLLWLADLDRTSVPPFVKTPPEELPASIPEDMVSKANHCIRSLQQLSEDVDGIQKQLDFIKGATKVLAAIAGIIIAFVGLTIAGVRFFSESPAVQTEPAVVPSQQNPVQPVINQNGNG